MQVVIESVTHVLPKECARPFGNSASRYLGKPPPSIPRHLHNSNWGGIPFLPLPIASWNIAVHYFCYLGGEIDFIYLGN